MNHKFILISSLSALALALLTSGCGGPRAFTKGEYDDPTQVELLDDKFNESDMQQMATDIIKDMVACPYVANATKPPIVIVERVQNRTQEHIDTLSMTDMIRTALIKSGKVRFINKEERDTVSQEYDYNASGAVNAASQKRKGNQIGADYIMSGEMSTNIQEVGSNKLIYYKLTMNMTNMSTTTIDCTGDKQVRKKFKKQGIDL